MSQLTMLESAHDTELSWPDRVAAASVVPTELTLQDHVSRLWNLRITFI